MAFDSAMPTVKMMLDQRAMTDDTTDGFGIKQADGGPGIQRIVLTSESCRQQRSGCVSRPPRTSGTRLGGTGNTQGPEAAES